MEQKMSEMKDETLKYGIDHLALSETVTKVLDDYIIEVDDTDIYLQMDNNKREIDIKIAKLEDEIKCFKNSASEFTPTTGTHVKPSKPTIRKKRISYNEITISEQNLLICDSNGKAIDTSRLHRTEKSKKVICYVLEDVVRFLDEATVEKQPEKILLHVGTNEIDIGVKEASLTALLMH